MERVVSVTNEGRYKVSIRKVGFGFQQLYWYRIEKGSWWQDGGPYQSQTLAEQAAREAMKVNPVVG